MTKQILAFLFCFTRELNLYTPLTDFVIIHIFYINESNPYTPLVTISHIQICYQLLQTHPTGEKRYQLLQTHPLTLLSARVTYERQSVLNQTQKKHPLHPPSKSLGSPTGSKEPGARFSKIVGSPRRTPNTSPTESVTRRVTRSLKASTLCATFRLSRWVAVAAPRVQLLILHIHQGTIVAGSRPSVLCPETPIRRDT